MHFISKNISHLLSLSFFSSSSCSFDLTSCSTSFTKYQMNESELCKWMNLCKRCNICKTRACQFVEGATCGDRCRLRSYRYIWANWQGRSWIFGNRHWAASLVRYVGIATSSDCTMAHTQRSRGRREERLNSSIRMIQQLNETTSQNNIQQTNKTALVEQQQQQQKQKHFNKQNK